MIIFNTTFHVEDDILDDYIAFMKEIYILRAADSGFLHEPRFARIHSQHEESGSSYSLQFRVKNVDTLDHWLATGGQALQQELTARFGNKALGFVTVLEEIDL
jgi:antibiotic biosynthesis monooxygenase (ABM) superfamily enzyme